MLIIKLFISKPTQHEIKSPSEMVQMLQGHCQPSVILKDALPKRISVTVVLVCGPGTFANKIRATTRDNVVQRMSIDFVEESFTW